MTQKLIMVQLITTLLLKERYLMNIHQTHIYYPNPHSITLHNTEQAFYCTLRILEPHIINVKLTATAPIDLPTYTVTPFDTTLPYEGLSRYHTQNFSLPDYKIEQERDTLIIQTTQLKVIINTSTFKCTWYQLDTAQQWTLLFKDRQTQAYQHHIAIAHPTCHYISRTPQEQYFGLGEKTGTVDKQGQRMRMTNIDAMGYNAQHTDPLYKHIPFYITHHSETHQSYGLFYDDYQSSIFDLGKELDNYHGYYRYYETSADFLDYYVIGGCSIKSVAQHFSQLTGRPTLFPSWSASYSGSTMKYTDEPHSQQRLNQFLEDCQQHDINVRSFHLSSGYTSIGDKRYVFNWNYDKFPDPQAFGQTFTNQNVEIVANIKPSLMLNHPLLDEVLAFNGFITDANGQPLKIQFWDDQGYYLDFTNPKTIAWWQRQIKTQLLDNHIHCTWNDNNEFEIWDNDATVYGFNGERQLFNDYRAVMPLLMSMASREIQQHTTDTDYPYIISRSGCAGMAKYVQTWTGDNATSWETLEYNNYMAQGLSLSGVHNFGHDIGGFSGPKPDPELFLRWVQNGIFYPRFSIHSWNSDATVNEPWMHPSVLAEVKDAMLLHERLIPYFDKLQQRSHQEFEAIVRPTFYDFEHDFTTLNDTSTWMLGPDLLVAPIVTSGQQQKSIYLPDNGTGWIDFFTQRYYDGGQTITIPVTLSTIPIFVINDSTIPLLDETLTETTHYTFAPKE